MKLIFSILSFIVLLSTFCFAQDKTQNAIKFEGKKGIYKNFESFRDNKPTADLNYDIKKSSKNIGGIFSSDNITAYRLDIAPKDKELVGSVFGFCDGTNFYFNRGIYNSDNYFNPKTDFFKMENYGRFTVYKAIGSSYSPTFSVGAGGIMMPGASSVSTKINMIIDMKTGYVQQLDKKYLIKILKDDEELSELFNKDRNKKTLLLDYLLWYNEKHPLIMKTSVETN